MPTIVAKCTFVPSNLHTLSCMTKKPPPRRRRLALAGAIGASRTRDLLLRRQLLYPAELQPQTFILYAIYSKRCTENLQVFLILPYDAHCAIKYFFIFNNKTFLFKPAAKPYFISCTAPSKAFLATLKSSSSRRL